MRWNAWSGPSLARASGHLPISAAGGTSWSTLACQQTPPPPTKVSKRLRLQDASSRPLASCSVSFPSSLSQRPEP
jgi:hypothetical protein